MKFTEEQFNRLVEIQEDQYQVDLFLAPRDDYSSIGDTVAQTDNDLEFFISQYDLGNEAVALMNPLTRELAHDQYVEKEKKYYWTSKKGNNVGIYEMDGIIFLKERYWAPLTESEIKAWGYNTEMFDKKELD